MLRRYRPCGAKRGIRMIELDLDDFRDDGVSGPKLTAISRLNASGCTNHTVDTRFGGRLATLSGPSTQRMRIKNPEDLTL
jgi:hypothetical protein